MTSRGQALVELAVCMPVVLLLGLGAAGVVEVADASSGLHAAIDAAVSAAARAPNASAATAAAGDRFQAIVAAYPVRNASFTLSDSDFARGAVIAGTAEADVDLGWEALAFVPGLVHLRASAFARAEPWRSR